MPARSPDPFASPRIDPRDAGRVSVPLEGSLELLALGDEGLALWRQAKALAKQHLRRGQRLTERDLPQGDGPEADSSPRRS